MGAFDNAANTIFADKNMASDASYRAGGSGVAVPIRAIIRAPDRFANFGDGRFLADTVLLDVKVSDVAVMAMGDTVQIGSVIYELRADPLRDPERLVWTAEVREL